MKRLTNYLRIAVFMVLLFAGKSYAETRYLSVIEDLPLAPDLMEVPDSASVFDNPDGRVVDVYAAGPVAAEKVRQFYAAALPKLGWQPQSALLYVRDNEQLQLATANDSATLTTVHFTLSPVR